MHLLTDPVHILPFGLKNCFPGNDTNPRFRFRLTAAAALSRQITDLILTKSNLSNYPVFTAIMFTNACTPPKMFVHLLSEVIMFDGVNI